MVSKSNKSSGKLSSQIKNAEFLKGKKNVLPSIDKTEFMRISKQYDSYDALREKLIITSRLVLKESKKLIFSLHRGDNCSTSELDSARAEIEKIISNDASLSGEPTYGDAMQEYVEAKSYFMMKNNMPFPSAKDLDVLDEYYLLGICDLPGELTRSSVNESIKGNYQYVEMMRNFVSELYGCLLSFNPRNGQLRKKIDAVKWELQKLDDLVLSNKKYLK